MYTKRWGEQPGWDDTFQYRGRIVYVDFDWNGKYRDTTRHFLKGDSCIANEVVDRICGSPDMYYNRLANASINFVTCHDGLTLMDLVSYNEKHNFDNGENNQFGNNNVYCQDNEMSWLGWKFLWFGRLRIRLFTKDWAA